MDLSRRRFLGMLGLAPVIPLVAPTKAYSFLGNILRPRATSLPPIAYVLSYFRVSVSGGPELFATKPGIDSALWFSGDIRVEDVLKQLNLNVAPGKELDYRMNFSSGMASMTEFGSLGGENPPLKKRALIPIQPIWTTEAARGKERPIG